MGRIIVAAFLLLAAPTAFADTLTGKVVKVADGDSISVLDSTNTRAASPATQNGILRSRLRRDLEKDGTQG